MNGSNSIIYNNVIYAWVNISTQSTVLLMELTIIQYIDKKTSWGPLYTLMQLRAKSMQVLDFVEVIEE